MNDLRPARTTRCIAISATRTNSYSTSSALKLVSFCLFFSIILIVLIIPANYGSPVSILEAGSNLWAHITDRLHTIMTSENNLVLYGFTGTFAVCIGSLQIKDSLCSPDSLRFTRPVSMLPVIRMERIVAHPFTLRGRPTIPINFAHFIVT